MADKHSLHKRIKKALFTNPVTLWILSRIIASYIRLVYYTSKHVITIHPDAEAAAKGEENVLIAFWHGRLLMMPMVRPPKRKMHVMISGHNDGLLIAHAMHAFGFGIVEGSSRRGGANAARGALELLQAGDNVSITPDGPKGPLMTAQQGVVAVARLAKKRVVPMIYASTRCKRFSSWDRFMIAFPFGTLHYDIGAPLSFERGESQEDAMRRCEEVMRAQAALIDARAGIA